MPRIEIAQLDITISVEAKLWSHMIDVDQVYAVLDHVWTVIRNRKERAAPFVLLGHDDQGSCLAIPILPTDDPVIWRPVTAWYCKAGEIPILRQRRILMDAPARYADLEPSVDDADAELTDAETWDWEHPVEGRTVGRPGAVVRLSFSREEYVSLARHAHAQGQSTHEFIKQLALAAVSVPTP